MIYSGPFQTIFLHMLSGNKAVRRRICSFLQIQHNGENSAVVTAILEVLETYFQAWFRLCSCDVLMAAVIPQAKRPAAVAG